MTQPQTFYPLPTTPARDAYGRAVEPVSYVPDWVRLVTEPERAVLERTAAGLMAIHDPAVPHTAANEVWPRAATHQPYAYVPAEFMPLNYLAERHASPRQHWGTGVLLSVLLGALGALAYAFFFVVTGSEVFATALIVGVLAGAGVRAGGRDNSTGMAVVAATLACMLLILGAWLGKRFLNAMSTGDPLMPMSDQAWGSVGAGVEQFFAEPVLAAITLGLAAAGAIATSAAYENDRRR